MKKTAILILTKEIGLYETFRENIREIFGDQIQLQSNHFAYAMKNLDKIDLILAGTDELYRDFIKKKNINIPCIIPNRSIDFNQLEQLFGLPQNTSCLLVSNDERVAHESVDLLNRLGFDYLSLIAYSSDMIPLPSINVDVAITHGLVDFVPETINRVIDLGNRSLDLSTLFEIAKFLHLPFEKSNHMTIDFVKNFVRIGKRLAHSLQNGRYLNLQLEAVLDVAQEGIIFGNEYGKITFFNAEASNILGIRREGVNGKHYTEVIANFPVEEVIKKRVQIPRHMIQYQGLNLLTTLNPIMLDNVFSGFVIIFQDVSHVQRMEQEIRKKQRESGLVTRYTFKDIIGNSNSIKKTKDLAKKLARSDYAITITGESGTGKEVFAQSIHSFSSRQSGPFVAVNFAGIPQSIAESELFGYEEGAFTGAAKGGKIGFFELAHNGTLFLDEIGDAPAKIQAAILRVIQEQEITRVGGDKVIPINVRLITATNKDFQKMIVEGSFREDLFYRLNQLPLHIPPLRERREDIGILIDYIMKKNHISMEISSEMLMKLSAYRWPGNIRELESTITYLSVSADGEKITVDDLPLPLREIKDDAANAKKIIKLLKSKDELPVFKEILHCLSLNKGRSSGIGRASLQSMMYIPISENQLRTKLNVLKKYDCVHIGQKKQGTSITDLGISVLNKL
ncbi:sigma-54 interaction domain-containing protein [Virgibacillus oceani]